MYKYIWSDEGKDFFVQNVNSKKYRELVDEASRELDVNVNQALDTFASILLKAGENMKKKVWFNTRPQHNTNKWFNRECVEKKREARRALNKFRRAKHGLTKLRLEAEYKIKRNEYKVHIKEERKNYNRTLHQSLLDNKRDSKKFWNTIRQSSCKKRNNPAISINAWQAHFHRVLNEHPDEGNIDNPHINETVTETHDTNIPLLDNPITEEEVKRSISGLHSGKSPGFDDIIGDFLKHSANLTTPFLTKLLNKLYDSSSYPAEWCKSIIIPIFKKGDENNPDNYRGISLLSIVSKVFTAVLNKRLYTWAESEDKISREQAGFRKNFSTVDHIFTLVSIIRKGVNGKRGGKIYVAFIDHKKAFDTVNRSHL